MTCEVTTQQALSWFTTLSNWGRWGDDDVHGTLNLVNAEHVRRAAQLVRHGTTVSCAWEIDTSPRPDQIAGPPQRWFLRSGQGFADEHRVQRPGVLSAHQGSRLSTASEYLGLYYHGYSVTHIDALSHCFWDGRMYNNRPAEWVTSALGATAGAVTDIGDGVTTRGVLVDMPTMRGTEWLEPGTAVHAHDLDEWEAWSGTDVRAGDSLLLRTGFPRLLETSGPSDEPMRRRAGYHACCLPWFRERDVAVVGADTANDTAPSGLDEDLTLPLHAIGIVAMGLWLIDNGNFERLARECAAAGSYEFMLTVNPLRFAGATGSPANPVAIL